MNRKFFGIAEIFLGVLIMFTASFVNSSVLFGIGGSFIGGGTVLIYSYYQLNNPKNKEKNEARKIECIDERKEMIRGKAARYTMLVEWVILSALICGFALLGDFGLIENYKPLVHLLVAFWLLSAIASQIIYRYLLKKY